MKKLTKEFFSLDTEQVAKNLIWKLIKVKDKYGIIYETEAYKQDCDQASHAWWRKTPRNALMYDTYWYVYVYLIYGMHYCLNFTADKEKAGAVLIRWVKEMTEDLAWRLSEDKFETFKNIDGCGRVCKYFWIDKSFNWLDLENNDKIQVYDIWLKVKNIKTTPRIWISKAKDKFWRFIWKVWQKSNSA